MTVEVWARKIARKRLIGSAQINGNNECQYMDCVASLTIGCARVHLRKARSNDVAIARMVLMDSLVVEFPWCGLKRTENLRFAFRTHSLLVDRTTPNPACHELHYIFLPFQHQITRPNT